MKYLPLDVQQVISNQSDYFIETISITALLCYVTVTDKSKFILNPNKTQSYYLILVMCLFYGEFRIKFNHLNT